MLKLIVLLFIICGITLFIYKSGLIQFFMSKERMRGFLDSLGPASYIGFILLQVIQVVAAPIPGEVTGILGGILYGPFLGVILSTIGLTIGSYINFALARSLGRPFVERFVDKSVMSRFDYLLHHKGVFLVFLLFLIPGMPKDFLCYILGLGHLSTLEFLLIGGFGRLFGTVLLSIAGNYIRLHEYGRFFALVGISLIVVIAAVVYKQKLERWFRIIHVADYKRKKAGRSKKDSDSA